MPIPTQNSGLRQSPSIATVGLLAVPNLAHACSVCFGAEGDPQTTGMTGAILTLLGITALVATGIAALVFRIMRHSRRYGGFVPHAAQPPDYTVAEPVEP